MSWYRSGTITVTNGSTAVAGVGTAWNGNAAVGEALLGPDGRVYEIASIGSDTALTLGSVYLGSTAPGQAYVIAPTQAYVRDLAAAAAALVSSYSASLATVVAGRFGDGAAATPGITFSADQDTGLFRPAANNVAIATGGVDRVRVDAIGNVAIGLTPSVWAVAANTRYLELGRAGNAFFGANGVTGLSFNAVSNGGWKYANDGFANLHLASASTFLWYRAATGLTGNLITFSESMRLDASGHWMVGKTVSGGSTAGAEVTAAGRFLGTSSGSTAAIFNRLADDGDIVTFQRNTSSLGAISVTAAAVSYNTTSDYRLKTNQQPLTGSGAFIDALQPKTWEWTADGSPGVGFIAHEVQAVSPGSVVGVKDSTQEEECVITPGVPAVFDRGIEITPAVPAVMGTRTVPMYQAMEYGSAEFIANIIAELQSLRLRVAALEAV